MTWLVYVIVVTALQRILKHSLIKPTANIVVHVLQVGVMLRACCPCCSA